MSTTRLAVIVMLLASTAVIARASRRGDGAAKANLAALPYGVSGWTGTEATPLDEETLRVLGADAYVNRTYIAGAGAPVGLYIAYYGAPRPGVSVHSPLHCLPGTGWEPLDVGTVDVASNQMRRLVVRKNGDRALVLYWYAMHGRVVSSEVMSKLWLLHDSIRYGRRDAALVRIVVPITGSVDDAERRGVAFTRDLLPYLSQLWS
jgi:EpsI family protein